MSTERMPGWEARRRRLAEQRFLMHRLGQLEQAYRDTGERALLLLDPRSDEAAAIRRVLLALEH